METQLVNMHSGCRWHRLHPEESGGFQCAHHEVYYHDGHGWLRWFPCIVMRGGLHMLSI